jgi:hypothetical protein
VNTASGANSQKFNIFVTQEYAQYAGVLYNLKLKRLERDKQLNLIVPFICCEETEVL